MAGAEVGFLQEPIAGYILTGGRSRRMNGQDKLLLNCQGTSFFDHIRKALGSFSRIYLSVAADRRDRYESLGLPMVTDRFSGLGPMGGIYSGLLSSGEQALFVVACDMPLIDGKTVDFVADCFWEDGDRDQVMVVRTGEQVHPLFGIYPKAALPLMEEMIREGNYRMSDFIVRSRARVLSLKRDSPVGINVNTEEEYQTLSRDYGI